MDIVVIGSCNTDLISYVPRMPKSGETIHGTKFQMGFGGKGANQCVASAKLGALAAMISKVGNDIFGNNYIQNFKDLNINHDFVTIDNDSSTGMASISVAEDGSNSIIIVAGANLKLNKSDIENAEDFISKAKVCLCQLEIDQSVSLEALKIAKKHNVMTIFNPAPAISCLNREFFKYSNIICLNETETELITGLPVNTIEEATKACEELLKLGCPTTILTLGSRGTLFASIHFGDGLYKVPKYSPAFKVDAVDTTGAGDAFLGTLAYCLAKLPNLSLEEVIQRANLVSSVSVQHKGTQCSYPTIDQLPCELFSM